jgi:hypothetical protein
LIFKFDRHYLPLIACTFAFPFSHSSPTLTNCADGHAFSSDGRKFNDIDVLHSPTFTRGFGPNSVVSQSVINAFRAKSDIYIHQHTTHASSAEFVVLSSSSQTTQTDPQHTCHMSTRRIRTITIYPFVTYECIERMTLDLYDENDCELHAEQHSKLNTIDDGDDANDSMSLMSNASVDVNSPVTPKRIEYAQMNEPE